jgi:hypothetical protein
VNVRVCGAGLLVKPEFQPVRSSQPLRRESLALWASNQRQTFGLQAGRARHKIGQADLCARWKFKVFVQDKKGGTKVYFLVTLFGHAKQCICLRELEITKIPV